MLSPLNVICGGIQFSVSTAVRSGKCWEEETWGKTEDGPEESHQINRGMESEVSLWEMKFKSIVGGHWLIAYMLSSAINYAFNLL